MPNMRVMLRKAIVALVVGLPLVLVVYAVLMGGAAMLVTLGDEPGALALRWIGTILAVLFVSGLIVLLLLLGGERITQEEIEPEE